MNNQPIKSARIFGNARPENRTAIFHAIGAAGCAFLFAIGVFLVVKRGDLNGVVMSGVSLIPALLLVLSFRMSTSLAVALSTSNNIWWRSKGRWRGPLNLQDVSAVDVLSIAVVNGRQRTFTTIILAARGDTGSRIRVNKEMRKLGVSRNCRGAQFRLSDYDATRFGESVFDTLDANKVKFTDRARAFADLA